MRSSRGEAAARDKTRRLQPGAGHLTADDYHLPPTCRHDRVLLLSVWTAEGMFVLKIVIKCDTRMRAR